MRFLFSYIFVSLLCFFSFRAISTPVTDILFIQNKALGTTAATASQKVAENLEAQIVNLYAITDEELIYDKTDPDMLVKMINNIYENGVFKSRLNIATNLSGISELSKNIEKVESIIALKKILGDSVSAAKSAKAMFSIAKDASKIKTRYRVLNNLIRYGTGNRESLYQLKLFLNNIDDASKAGSYLYETYQFIKKVDSIEKTTNKGLDAIRYLLVHVQSEIAHEMAVNLKSGQWAKLVIQDFILKRWKEDGRYGDYVNQNMISYIRDESCLKLLTFGCKVKIVTSNSIVDERELELSPITFHLKSTPIENEANKYLIEIPSSLISEWKIGDIESIKFTEFGEELDLSQTNVSDVTYLSSDQTPNSLVISLNEDNLFYYISARVIFNSGEEYLFYDKEVSYISNPDSIDVLEYPSDVQAENDAKIKVKSCGDFLYEASFWYKNTSRDTWFKSYLNIDSSSYDGECYTYNFSVLGAELDSHIWSGDNFDFYISGGTQKSSIHKSFLIDANDIDNDGMNDSCENEYFKGLNEKAQDDYDHDGVINVLECSQGTDPTKPGTEGVSKTLQINNHLLEDGTAINTCRLDDIYLSHVDVSCSNVTLYENVTISGDMSITSNKFNLNGYRLTVGGSLSIQGNLNINDGVTYVGKDIIHTSGTLDMSGGSLIVKGDYRIQKPDDINGGYTFSDGILRMEGDNDYLIVEGDFVMDSRYGGFKTGSTYSIHYNGDWLTAGTLEVKGDFTQLSSAKSNCNSGITDCNYYSEQNFQASGTHKVALSGTELQTVHFEDSTNSYFNELEIKNINNEGIKFSTSPKVVKLFNHNRLVFNSELGGSFVDYDEDGIKDNIDEFPMNANNVGVDTDLDGIPDFQDTDDDNDGILDAVDAFSLNVAASIDTDLDGLPDSFHASCNDECITESGLILDLDDDNDGISDDEDDYPLDQGKSKDNRIALNIYVPESAYNVAVGETVTIPVMYKASDDSQISALSFKLYFNSQLLQWNQVTNLISTGLLGGMDTVFVDENDSDNNALTDSYLQVTWFDLSKNWPGESGVVKLFDIEFTLLQDLAEDTTSLSIVGDETGVSTGYKVVSEPINIAMNSNSFSLDVNGDGKVSLPVDGFIILRSMVGFPAPALASNDDMFDATRTREEMADLLNNAKTDLSLDINGDGKVSLPIDGFIILRHMVGFPASALASDEDMVGATRTRDEMKSYLTGSQ